MVGNVPDYHATLTHYADLADNKTSAAPAPVYPGLFMLGALGSRGLCSAPLCAEILAAQMSNEPIPLDAGTLAALNPNRLWVKVIEGKSGEVMGQSIAEGGKRRLPAHGVIVLPCRTNCPTSL